jgi:tetratricopeptide (TPR) repeat protein
MVRKDLKTILSVISATLFLLIVSSHAQDAPDFDWSWDDDDKPKTDSAADAPAKGLEAAGEEFKWSIGGDGPPPKAAAPLVPKKGAATRIRDDESYQKLLKENLELRRKMAEALKDEELARKESQKLAVEIKGMETSLSDSVRIIKNLKTSQDSAISPDMMIELEAKLSKTENARDLMAAELDRLKKMRDREKKEPKVVTASVVKGSDLFKETEKQNVLLKRRIGEIESRRIKLERQAKESQQEAEKAQQEAEKTRAALEALSEKAIIAARQGAKYKKIVDKVPAMQEQVSLLQTDVAQKDERLSARAQQLMALKVELDRREHRISKQQKMTDLLERARSEILQVNNREKLDMHYNMAVIYAKEGRTHDAEVEYLKALRIDPTDADLHYNLGILYDEGLRNPKKAVRHYRRYMTLRPNAIDTDQVKNWILDIEMAP